MKKILNFEINKKASKVNQQQKHKARRLAGKYYTHAHSTLKHARAVAERPRPSASCSRGIPAGSSTRTTRRDYQTGTVQTELASSSVP